MTFPARAPIPDSTPIAIPYLVLHLAAANGRYNKGDVADSPIVIGSADPAGALNPTTGDALAPGSYVAGTNGFGYIANSSGTPIKVALAGAAQTWTGLQTFGDGIALLDADPLVFGTGADISFAWDGTNLKVTQAAPNSAVEWGVNGAGIDQIHYGDTASASMTWDQSADALVFAGVAKIKLQTIAAATATAIPVTHSGSFPITTAAAETNTLADPTFLGQTISMFLDTRAVGDRVVTAASRINQAGTDRIMTFGAAGDFIKLEAITVAGALKWQIVSNDGVALS